MTNDYRRLLLEKADGIGWLILNRPEAGNAFDAAMLDDLELAWRELDDDPDVRVIVNTASGKSFCTGMDVAQIARDKSVMRKHSRHTRDAELRISSWHCDVWKPVIVAVNGTCAGGGLHLVADADIVIAADTATFVDPHVSVGQAVAYEAITLARKSAMEAIMRMALSGNGERISATRAFELGIVGEVVSVDDLRGAAQRTAELVAKNSPSAMRASKMALWHSLEVGVTQARAHAMMLAAEQAGHPDWIEGPTAFVEGRAPRWDHRRSAPPRTTSARTAPVPEHDAVEAR